MPQILEKLFMYRSLTTCLELNTIAILYKLLVTPILWARICVAITSTSNTVAVTTTQYVWTPSWWFYLLLSSALAAVFVAVTAGAAVLVFIIAKRGGRITPNFGLSESVRKDSAEYATMYTVPEIEHVNRESSK